MSPIGEKQNVPITSEEIDIYQKLSQFCPLKIDLAELKTSIDLLTNNVDTIGQKMNTFEKVFIDYKVMETEFAYFKKALDVLEKSFQREKDDSVAKKDITIYLTIGSLVIVILSTIIGVVMGKLI